MAARVDSFMRDGGVEGVPAREALEKRHGDPVGAAFVIGSAILFADRHAIGGEGAIKVGVPLVPVLNDRLGGRIFPLGKPLNLLDVEHGIAFQEGDTALALGLGRAALALFWGETASIDDHGTALPFTNATAKLPRLFEGHPSGIAIAAPPRLRPQQQEVEERKSPRTTTRPQCAS